VIVSFFFVSGLMFANLGMIGLYLGNVFNETKGRPLYVVKGLTNFEKHADQRP
jgi:polyisoprenyl-phosphate glycosyltransferase